MPIPSRQNRTRTNLNRTVVIIVFFSTIGFLAALGVVVNNFDGTLKLSEIADERDRHLMEAFLLHVLTSSEFNFARIGTNGAEIVLDSRTPGGNRRLRPDLMWHPDNIGAGHSIPEDVQRDIVRRNGRQPASFTDLRFDKRITVATIPRSKGRGPAGLFEQAHPNGLAWIQAWLPGYSADGTQAVVRGWIGPRPGGAQLTAFLEKKGEVWLVKWHYLQRF
jgi:hypothetical protein